MSCLSIGPKIFQARPKCFGPDQKQFFTTGFHILNHLKNVWYCPKQKSFGPIEGQGNNLCRSLNLVLINDRFFTKKLNKIGE